MKTSSNLNEHSNQLNIPRIVSNKDKHIFIKTSWNRAAGSSFYRSFGLSVGQSVGHSKRGNAAKSRTRGPPRHPQAIIAADRPTKPAQIVVDRWRRWWSLCISAVPAAPDAESETIFGRSERLKHIILTDWLTFGSHSPAPRPWGSVYWLQPAAPAVATACGSFFLCKSASLPLSANAHIRGNRRLAN